MVWLALLTHGAIAGVVFNNSLFPLRSDAVLWSTIYVSFDMLRQLDPIHSLVAALLLVNYVAICMIACAAAQVTSFWILRFAQALMGVRPMHFQYCRSCTAACINEQCLARQNTCVSVKRTQ